MKSSKNVASKISGCLLAVLSFVGAAFAQNGVIPTPAVSDPMVALTHSLNGNPYGLDTYNANTEVFSVSGAGTSITIPPVELFCNSPCAAPVLSVTIQVDNTGKLIGGNPNSSQPDLVLDGQITDGATTYTSPLLTGQITQFYFDGVNDTPNFAFLFTVTGGSMASLYLNPPSLNNDLWLTLNLENQTGYANFAGSFANNFGGVTKANIYGTPPLSVSCAAINTGDVGVPFDSGPMNVTGGTPPYSYSIVGALPAGLTLNTSTGEVTGTPTEAGAFTVKVTDAGGMSSTSCTITINGPLSVTCAAVTTGDVGVPFNSGPMNVTGGTAPYSYSIVGVLPAGLTLNTLTGAVTGTPTSSGTFTVQVTDATGNSSTSCMITINGPLSVTCAAINTGTVGVPFDSGLMTVSGGTAPYSYSVVGTLPPGLSLNSSTGEVTGTPTEAGTFTVKVTDATGNSSTSCMITINPAPLAVTCAAINTGDVGVPFDSGPMNVTGGTAPYSYSIVGTLPPGLTLNTSTGEVTGTPTEAGAFTVRVTDAAGISSSSCMITINSPLSVTCAAINTGDVGVPFDSGPMNATGGTAPYSYSLAPGNSLPPGLSLNSLTGEVTGTPTAAGTFTVQVTDALGNSSTSCMITINGPLSVNCAAINTGDVGVPFDSGALTVTGGTTPYTFSIVGTLPAGLSLNPSTGEVTGTPTASGTFAIQVTDAVGNSSTTCMITINGPLSVTCAAVTTGDVGVPFNSGPMIVTGGTAPYTYSIVGTLPTGLSLNTGNGAISGTPTSAGSFTVQVTDATGATSSSCAITINTPLSVTCAALTTGDVGVPFNSGPMIVTGGTAPYTYSIVGTLPAGLTLNTSTGAVTGIPTSSGTFTVQVTDATGNSSTSCMITINSSLSVTCASVTTGEVSVPFNSGPMTVTGGTAPYTYSIVGTLPAGLSLNTGNGAITGTPTAAGTFSVKVTDAEGATSTACAITIVTGPSVSCSATTSGQVGVSFNSGSITVTGGVAPYTFSIVGTLPAGLTLNTTTGAVTGTPTAAGSFSIQVKDANGVVGNATCPITIAASPVSATCVSVNAQKGVAITPVTLVGSGGSGGPYTFSATGLPSGLKMASNGTISGTPTATGTFTYTVTVTDSAGHTGTLKCSITVVPPITSNCGCDTVTEYQAMTPVTLTASGGAGGPYTFTASGLPAGLSISTSGTISGTATVSGEFNYTVTITDSAGNSATIQCMITVKAAPPVTTTCACSTAQQGVALTPVTMVGSGGVGGPYKFTATGLPAGLSISTSGTISGTPTVSGTFSYTVTVTDSAGNKGTVTCTVTVKAAPPVTTTCACSTAQQGVALTPVTMVGSGGAGGPYTFTATGLPAGLTISSSGTISGTPTVSGTFSYTVTVTDSAGNKGTVTCTVTVKAMPPVTSSCGCDTVTKGKAMTPVTLTASGGTGGPYTFTASGLPAGLSISSSGTISGTPTVTGEFNYTVTITDHSGHTGTINCMITVN